MRNIIVEKRVKCVICAKSIRLGQCGNENIFVLFDKFQIRNNIVGGVISISLSREAFSILSLFSIKSLWYLLLRFSVIYARLSVNRSFIVS